MKKLVKLLGIVALTVVAATSVSRADSLVASFNMDGNQNAVPSIGTISLTLNNGQIDASLSLTQAVSIFEVNSIGALAQSAFSSAFILTIPPASGIGLYGAGFASFFNITHETWKIGSPNQYGSVKDILGGSAPTSFAVFQVNRDTGAVTAEFTAKVDPPATVPEPSSFALLGLGVIGLATRAFRRRALPA